MKIQIAFYPTLYKGKGIYSWDIFRLKFLLKHHQDNFRKFLLIKSTDPQGQLDIIRGDQLGLPIYQGAKILVFGIAKSNRDAIDLLIEITEESVAAGYDGNILKYLKHKMKQ